MSLRGWFSVSRKGGTGGDGLVYAPKGWKQQGLCVGLAIESLSRVIVQMVLQNSLLTSQGLHAVLVFPWSWRRKKKNPADIAYDCQGISGLTSTIALAAASSSLKVSMIILSYCKPTTMLLLCIHCAQSVRLIVPRLDRPCGPIPRLFSLGTLRATLSIRVQSSQIGNMWIDGLVATYGQFESGSLPVSSAV